MSWLLNPACNLAGCMDRNWDSHCVLQLDEVETYSSIFIYVNTDTPQRSDEDGFHSDQGRRCTAAHKESREVRCGLEQIQVDKWILYS